MSSAPYLTHSYRRSDNRYYRTDNLQLAAVLLARGFSLVNIDGANRPRCQFVFRTSYALEDFVERYLQGGTVLVDARKLFFCWQLLRDRIARGPL